MSEPILLNNPEEWDFTDYIDSLIQEDEAFRIERLYPGTPNHPKQKYRATPSSSFNN